MFSTHFDCVPPFFPSRVDDGDRCTAAAPCDAKGILAAQVAAADRLRRDGEQRVGLLFVVGEERGSDGAAVANASPRGSRFLINGEPTDSRLGTGTRGRAAAQVTRDRTRRALVVAGARRIGDRQAARCADRRCDRFGCRLMPISGQTYYSIGLIEGGVAPNVVSPSASAEVLFRTVGPPEDILLAVQPLQRFVTSEEVLRVPVVKLHTVPGFQTAAFPFTTDVPFLDRWGTPLLFGPGSILVAHTSDEHVDLGEFDRAIDSYERLARGCLEGGAPV